MDTEQDLTAELAEDVQRGIERLDHNQPGWWKLIDLSILNMEECSHCVLGQLAAIISTNALIGRVNTYTWGFSQIAFPNEPFSPFGTQAERHGFCARSRALEESADIEMKRYEILTRLWRDEIVRRQQEAGA